MLPTKNLDIEKAQEHFRTNSLYILEKKFLTHAQEGKKGFDDGQK